MKARRLLGIVALALGGFGMGCVRTLPPGEFKVQITHRPGCVAVEPKPYEVTNPGADFDDNSIRMSHYRLDRGERTLRFDCDGRRVEQKILVEGDMGRSLDAANPPWKP